MRLSFEANHGQATAHRRCIRTPLLVVGHRPGHHFLTFGAGELPGPHRDPAAGNAYRGFRLSQEILPPPWRLVVAEVRCKDDEVLTVGHIPQHDSVRPSGVPAHCFEHQAPQTRGEMLRTTICSQEQTGVQLCEGSIEVLTKRCEVHLCQATEHEVRRVGDCPPACGNRP